MIKRWHHFSECLHIVVVVLTHIKVLIQVNFNNFQLCCALIHRESSLDDTQLVLEENSFTIKIFCLVYVLLKSFSILKVEHSGWSSAFELFRHGFKLIQGFLIFLFKRNIFFELKDRLLKLVILVFLFYGFNFSHIFFQFNISKLSKISFVSDLSSLVLAIVASPGLSVEYLEVVICQLSLFFVISYHF